MTMYGRNFGYAIRVPVTILGETHFKVEYHSLSKAILGKLIHLPGDKIKEFYMSNDAKYNELMKKEMFEANDLTYVQTGIETTLEDSDLLNEDDK